MARVPVPEAVPPRRGEGIAMAPVLLERILDLGTFGVVLFGPDRRATWAAGVLPGMTPDEAVGLDCDALFGRTSERCVPCLLEESRTGPPVRRTLRPSDPQARDRMFEVHIAWGVAGGGDGWLALFREIRAPGEIGRLFRSEAMDLAGLIATWSVPLILVDGEGRVLSWNRGASKLYGWREEDATGRPWRELVGEDPSIEPPLAPGTGTRRYAVLHVGASGVPRDVLVTRTDLPGTGSGSILLIQDVTEAKAMERQLERRVAQLSVVREIGEALQITSDLNRILRTVLVGATAGQGLRFNRAFLLLVDERLGELRGRLAIGPADQSDAERIWMELAQSGRSLQELFRDPPPAEPVADDRVNAIVRGLAVPLAARDHFLVRTLEGITTARVSGGRLEPGGEPVDSDLCERLGVVTFVAVPLRAEARPVGLLLADNAVTGRPIEDADVEVLELLAMQAALAIQRASLAGELARQVASLERATQELRMNQERLVRAERLSAVGEMAARVAHEIRNPLVAIGGFARSLLLDAPGDDRSREALQIIVAETRRLEAIVREVLDFARPSPPRIGRLDVARTAADALDLLRWEMEEAGVSPALEADPVLPPAAADRDHIFQALVNILRNAVHAMPNGGRLTTRIAAHPGWLEIQVEDTGEGIPPEIRGRVFEPFFTTKSTGSGLGLTIASQIVNDHRGKIDVTSEPGGGTVVRVQLPAVEEGTRHGEDPGH
jgi:PAS domain S-box-containing protein